MNARVAAIICLVLCGFCVVLGIMIDATPTIFVSKDDGRKCANDATYEEWGIFTKCWCGTCKSSSKDTEALENAANGQGTGAEGNGDDGCDARIHMERGLQACAILFVLFAAVAGVMNLVCILKPIGCLYCWREVFQILAIFMSIICIAVCLAYYFSKMCDKQYSKTYDLGWGFFLLCGQFVVMLIACCVLPCGGDGSADGPSKPPPKNNKKNDDVEMKSNAASNSAQPYKKIDEKGGNNPMASAKGKPAPKSSMAKPKSHD